MAWSRAHPDETVERAEDSREFTGGLGLPLEGAWCARAVRRARLADGRIVVRSVFFYPPDAPEATGDCRAGAVTLESREPDKARADSLALTLRQRLTRRYGRGRRDGRLATWWAGDWRKSTFWRRPGESLIATAAGGASLGRVLVLAWGAQSGISSELAGPETFARDSETVMLRQLVALGPLDSGRAERLIALRAAAFWAEQGMIPATLTDSVLWSVLAPWVRSADSLAPRARLAALLVADRLLGQARVPALSEPDSAAARARLERLGARFEQYGLGDHSYIYANSWLWEAFRRDTDGPVGQRALLVLLRQGFYTGALCGGSSGRLGEEFRDVIAQGERALAGPLEPALRSEIEALVAHAYGDILYLASNGGFPSDELDPAHYHAEVPQARGKAIEHYGAAIRLTGDPLVRLRLRQSVWRLRTGLSPLLPHFICAYD